MLGVSAQLTADHGQNSSSLRHAGTVQLKANNSGSSNTVTLKANSDLVARQDGAGFRHGGTAWMASRLFGFRFDAFRNLAPILVTPSEHRGI